MNIPRFSPLREHARRHISTLIGIRSGQIHGPETHNTDALITALGIFLEQAPSMDMLCDPDSAFARHFRDNIANPTLTDSEILPLLEDILILIREKNLRAPALQNCQSEIQLINTVESGTVWSPTDNTAFTMHYFYDLPLHIAKSIMEQIPVRR